MTFPIVIPFSDEETARLVLDAMAWDGAVVPATEWPDAAEVYAKAKTDDLT